MRMAIVHDWLSTWGGAENTLESLVSIFPDADIYSVFDVMSREEKKALAEKNIKTTFIQRMPFLKRLYRFYLPFICYAIEQIDLKEYDVVLSSSHSVAKGIITRSDQLHICLCYTPMRYAWDQYSEYMQNESSWIVKTTLARILLHKIRIWDLRTANSVDLFIGISEHIKRRIWKTYRRRSLVVYPPVDISDSIFVSNKKDYYVTVSRLVPYKQIDKIISAFTQLDRKLYVIGDGPEVKRLSNMATENVELLGHVSRQELLMYIANAKGFIYASEEDFGIAPVEALAAGTPILAYRSGALKEILKTDDSEISGIFFNEQSSESIKEAIRKLEAMQFDMSENCRKNSLRFSKEKFENRIKQVVLDAWKLWCDNGPELMELELVKKH